MNMLRYIAKRMIISIPVLIGITAILFVMLNVIPGDRWPDDERTYR